MTRIAISYSVLQTVWSLATQKNITFHPLLSLAIHVKMPGFRLLNLAEQVELPELPLIAQSWRPYEFYRHKNITYHDLLSLADYVKKTKLHMCVIIWQNK